MAENFVALLRENCESTPVTYAAGKTVFRRGDPVRYLYLVVSGQLRLARILAKGTEIALSRTGDGGILAEASVYAARYHCDAVTETASVLHRFAMRDVTVLLQKRADVAAAYGAHLAHELMDLRAKAEIRAIRRADERLLCWLRLRASGTPPVFRAQGGLIGIAREIGLTPESLYRALASLERTRRIRREGQKIVLGADER